MARPVLRLGAAVLALSLAVPAAFAAGGAAKAPPCAAEYGNLPQAQQAQARDFVRKVQSGPFYRHLTRSFGRPLACTVSAKESAITLAFTFPGGAGLRSKVDSAIELSEQRMVLPSITTDAAVTLLKQAEKHSYGQKGCGISWSSPERESKDGGNGVIYRGESCNCQGRVVRRPKSVEVVLSSAC